MSGRRLLVLGLGNVLCRDDGVGVVAVTRLSRTHRAPEHALVLDGGTLGLSLLPHLRDADDVILVDAVAADAPAGTLVRLEGSAVAPAVEQRLSSHQVGVADLLDAVRLLGEDGKPRMVLVGAVPERIELGTGLTLEVAAAVDGLVAEVVAQAAALGYVFSPDEGGADAEGGDVDRVARVVGM